MFQYIFKDSPSTAVPELAVIFRTVLGGGKVPLDTTPSAADINEFVLAMDNSDGENFAPETITKDATPVDQLIQRATNTDGEQQGW